MVGSWVRSSSISFGLIQTDEACARSSVVVCGVGDRIREQCCCGSCAVGGGDKPTQPPLIRGGLSAAVLMRQAP